MQVRFIQRYGAWFPGSMPVLGPDDAARLIALGVCESAEDPAAPPVDLHVPQTVDEPTDIEPSDVVLDEDSLESLGLKSRTLNALQAAGIESVSALLRYGNEYGTFVDLDGIGEAANDEIVESLTGRQP